MDEETGEENEWGENQAEADQDDGEEVHGGGVGAEDGVADDWGDEEQEPFQGAEGVFGGVHDVVLLF